MKKILLISGVVFISVKIFSQVQINKIDGGSVVTKLGFGINVNDGSSLKRDWIMLNDPTCPVQLKNVGITTNYADRSYSFKASGELAVSEAITAYEIHHVLYNVFGEHMKTLSNQEITDISDKTGFSKYSSWYASENDISEYLFVVTYVANVRTKGGTVWKYRPNDVKEELQKIKITYEADYIPSKKEKE